MTTPALPQMPRKRGRPRLHVKVPVGPDGITPLTPEQQVDAKKAKRVLTDAETLERVRARFEVMLEEVRGMVGPTPGRSLVISGAPGVGKTYSIGEILGRAEKEGKIKFEVVRGTLTGINLYKLLYRNRGPNAITVLDDVDSVFADENAMNILKAALDTSKLRRLSWFSESFTGTEMGDEEGLENIPQQFDYEGMCIFITNLDFDAYLAAGRNKFTRHMEAFLNRSLYCDLLIHGKRELALWIGHVLTTSSILQKEYSLTDKDVAAILDYLARNQNAVRSLSIRSAIQCAGLMKRKPDTWRAAADVLLLKGK